MKDIKKREDTRTIMVYSRTIASIIKSTKPVFLWTNSHITNGVEWKMIYDGEAINNEETLGHIATCYGFKDELDFLEHFRERYGECFEGTITITNITEIKQDNKEKQ